MKKLKSHRLGFGFCLRKTEPSRRSKNYVALHIYFLRTLKSPLNTYPHCLTPLYLFFSLNKYIIKISLTDLFISPCDKNQHLKICLNHQTKILNHEDLKFTYIYIYILLLAIPILICIDLVPFLLSTKKMYIDLVRQERKPCT